MSDSERVWPDGPDMYALCPVDGEPIDYCLGHGEIGDPDGYAILNCHDEGDHLLCHPLGCELAGKLEWYPA